MVFVDQLIILHNEQLSKHVANFIVNSENEFVINVTTQYYVDVLKVWLTIKIDLPEDENDKNYRREYFKTSIDCEKLAKGIHGNYMIKGLAEQYLKHIDFELKFPMKKVIIKQRLVNLKLFHYISNLLFIIGFSPSDKPHLARQIYSILY